jgi:adenine-specific DNA-methyltransferase
MIYERVLATLPLMLENAIMAFAIDDTEHKYAHIILDNIFKGQELANVVIRNNPSGRPVPTGFAISHEYVLFYSKQPGIVVSKLGRDDSINKRYKEQDSQGMFMWKLLRKRGSNSTREDSPKAYYPIYYDGKSFRLHKMEWDDLKEQWINIESPRKNEIAFLPIDENGVHRCWRWGITTTAANLHNLMLKNNSVPTIYYKYRPPEGVTPTTDWIEAKYSSTEYGTGILNRLFPEYQPFSFPKSIYAVEDCLRVAGLGFNDTTLDYFAGSGTTAHAVINLNRSDKGNRKYILVEMGEYFDTVTKHRVEKVIYSDKWKDGKPQNDGLGISHAFKYLRLESYEDALENIILPEKSKTKTLFQEEYFLKYMFDVEAKGHTLLSFEHFNKPFDYKLSIWHNSERKSSLVDLPETFNFLSGLIVTKNHSRVSFGADFTQGKYGVLTAKLTKGNSYTFKAIEGTLSRGESTLVIWRSLTDDIQKDNAVLDAFRLQFGKYKNIFINGESNVEGASTIEALMKSRMFEDL